MLRALLAAALAGLLTLSVGASPARAQLPVQLPPLPILPTPGSNGTGPQPQPYRTNDYGGFMNILPPGENGFDNVAQLGAFESGGQLPAHTNDQYAMYQDLLYATPGLKQPDLGRYFKDASFGVPPGQAARVYSPRNDVTIVRDSQYGVPHIYASTRGGAMFGEGYATAEDRLFFIDALRHAGRGELASFAGGSPANRQLDEQVWATAPYTEGDLQQQITDGPILDGSEGSALEDDLNQYVAGINEYINEARLNPQLMPAEYAAIGQPLGPQLFQGTDVVAIATLVGSIFGVGGGGQLYEAELLRSFKQRFGARTGQKLWGDFRELDDPEAPTTLQHGSFPYDAIPRHLARGSEALPDPGSVTPVKSIVGTAASGAPSGSTSAAGAGADGPTTATPKALATGLLALPRTLSNALVVSARDSASGHPLAVFGPQVAYFMPEILMEQDVHAPGIDARGAAFPGTNLYVELGRGRDYAWSATSAGQPIVDTFAVPLCEPNGQPATTDSSYYEFRGKCLPMDTLTRVDSWTPNAADQTPAGSETLTTQRTALGLVIARARVHGRPVAYTSLRSTYMHESDSVRGFADLNNPDKIRSPADFERAASEIGYTFNWFYVDNKHDAYVNSGYNPVRAAGTNGLLPVSSQYPWVGLNTTYYTAAYTPSSHHPHVVDQPIITSWNNKQAHGYASSGPGYGPVYRSQLLDDRLGARLRHGKLTLSQVVDSMEQAGTTDLRATHVLPLALKVIGHPRDPRLAAAVSSLSAWVRAGGQRIGAAHSGPYRNSDAIATLDAWWPRWVTAEFEPRLGSSLFTALVNTLPLDNPPNVDPGDGVHLGSSWQNGWYGYVDKDLRSVLRRRERDPMHRRFCGGGSLVRCRAVLEATLLQALGASRSALYQDPSGQCPNKSEPDPQRCFDAIGYRAVGAITLPMMDWVNRPTFQQVVEVMGHRPVPSTPAKPPRAKHKRRRHRR